MNTNTQVPSFKGEWDFLSNMYRCKVFYNGIQFPTSEHAYVMAKVWNSDNPHQIDPFELNLMAQNEVKKWGRKLNLVEHWDQIKGDIMRQIVFAKFCQNVELRHKLCQTGHEQIEEGNTWGDTYYGMIKGGTHENGRDWYHGKNVLGEILMDVRDYLNLQRYNKEHGIN